MSNQISKLWRVVIADDHPITGRGLSELIEHTSGFELEAIATDGRSALKTCAATRPDLLILDLALPGMSGLRVIEELMRLAVRPGIVVISGVGIATQFAEARRLGVEGLVSKEDETSTIADAMWAVREGAQYVSPAVQTLLRPEIGDGDSWSHDGAGDLTRREREVLSLIAEGLSTNEIGERLSISPNTAKKHRENVRRKLGISNAAEAARVAVRLGLVKY